LTICLSAKLINNVLSIRVENTGKLFKADSGEKNNSDGTGNGIENIKNRLALFYNDNYSFSLTEENGWVVSAIDIKNIHI
jgi:sensor histidine kinase YesM